MPAAVVNASPLVFLAKLDRIGALRAYSPVITTTAVVREIEEGLPGGHPEILAVRRELAAGRLQVRRVSESPIPGLDLDPGELTVLRLASRISGCTAVVDDGAAIRAARRNGIRVLSTPFLLLEGLARGEMDPGDFRRAMDRLLAEGYHLSARLYLQLIEKAEGAERK